jgi:hypothetical protein
MEYWYLEIQTFWRFQFLINEIQPRQPHQDGQLDCCFISTTVGWHRWRTVLRIYPCDMTGLTDHAPTASAYFAGSPLPSTCHASSFLRRFSKKGCYFSIRVLLTYGIAASLLRSDKLIAHRQFSKSILFRHSMTMRWRCPGGSRGLSHGLRGQRAPTWALTVATV